MIWWCSGKEVERIMGNKSPSAVMKLTLTLTLTVPLSRSHFVCLCLCLALPLELGHGQQITFGPAVKQREQRVRGFEKAAKAASNNREIKVKKGRKTKPARAPETESVVSAGCSQSVEREESGLELKYAHKQGVFRWEGRVVWTSKCMMSVCVTVHSVSVAEWLYDTNQPYDTKAIQSNGPLAPILCR